MALRSSRASAPDAPFTSASSSDSSDPSSTSARARYGSGTRPSGRAGVRPGGRRSVRGRSALASAAARRRADALMAGAAGLGNDVAPGVHEPAEPPASASTPSVPVPRPGTAGEAPGGTSRVRRLVSAARERLPLWVRLRCGMAPRTPVVLGLVLLAAVAVATVHFWSVRPQPVRAPEPVADESAALALPPDPLRSGTPDPVPRPAAGEPPGTGGGNRSGEIVVDVSGEVHRPGVRRLPAGSRVEDALEAAGGVRAGTDVTGLNRARVLVDGEQVAVGLPPGPPVAGATAGGGAGAGPSAPLSLNSATAEQFETLPGVGPVLAQHMIDYRTENNGFRSVDELRQVNGIGDRRFAVLRPLVRP
nr:ComEA family DNA-binding protein [Streptomyces sp. EN27]